jgi:hypothetical protein
MDAPGRARRNALHLLTNVVEAPGALHLHGGAPLKNGPPTLEAGNGMPTD